MKKDAPFEWDESCRKAFENIKQYLSTPPVIGAPIPGKSIILYISAQEHSMGALCAQENEDGKERALYYLSRTLVGAELKYSPIKKMCLALIFAIQKLRHYFQAHTVHKAVKGQALADFLADHPVPGEWNFSDELPGEEVFYIDVLSSWQMYFDGAARQDGAGAGVVFISPEKHLVPYSFILPELYTNNAAEYQALIISVQMALEMGCKDLNIYGDSKLIINQLLGEYEVKEDSLVPYHKLASRLLQNFDSFFLDHVPRSAKKMADALENLAATLALGASVPTTVPICKRWVVLPEA
ncbi:uncharacterized protein LOC141617041 [Silene latifolia]|uniref:uncharacterized protein LOC141617041 n=1 Tax=Silene latifolia TaxID=37657 RepID=UPI003D77FDD6